MPGGQAEYWLRLTELLTARLCHEMVSPIGAIGNGVEILLEDASFAAEAAGMVGDSARQAARRLQFYRVAYGSTAPVPFDRARSATLELFAGGRIACVWPDALIVPAEHLKLAANLALLASEALPRGGRLELHEEEGRFGIVATGEGARLPQDLVQILDGGATASSLDPRNVQGAFTKLLAERAGLTLVVAAGDGRVRFGWTAADLPSA